MKKFLAVCLSVCIVFTCFTVPGFAIKSKNNGTCGLESGGNYPLVIVRGISFTGLYYNYGKVNQEPAIKSITASGVLSAVFKTAGAGLVHHSFDSAVDEIVSYAGDVMGKLGCNKDGTSAYNIGLPQYPLSVSHYKDALITGGGTGNEEGIVKSAAERYGGDNVYYYTYDWRLNPLEVCDGINDMVKRASTEHHDAKVNIVCCSMGGIETIAYLTKYGYDKVNKCVFLSSTFYGTYVVSDILCGRVAVTEDTLFNFIKDKTQGSGILNFTVKTLYKTKVIKAIAGLADKFIGKYKEKIYKEFITDTLGTMPVWWGLMQGDDYKEALQYMFGGHEKDYAGVIAISKELQAMMAGRDRLLKEAASHGVQFAVVANYDSALPPIYERACKNSDGGLETALVSGGATVADYGKTLDAGYTPLNSAYLSPDRVIDASTCLFPDYTWLVKNGAHVSCSYGTEYSDFLFWLLDDEIMPTVFSSAQYPQFMLSGKGEFLKTW